MTNGGTIYAGRAVRPLSTGRAIGSIVPSPAIDTTIWPRTGAMCAPLVQCCCKGPWSIGPGETLPLVLDWSQWLASLPGYNLNKVAEMDLFDMTVNPPRPADHDIITITTGTGDDPDEPDNADLADRVSLIPPSAMQMLVEVSEEAVIGAQFKLSLAVTARDCDGRRITMRDCVVITIAEC